MVGCGDRKELIARPAVCAKRYPRYCFAVRVLFWALWLMSSDVSFFFVCDFVSGFLASAKQTSVAVLCASVSKLICNYKNSSMVLVMTLP